MSKRKRFVHQGKAILAYPGTTKYICHSMIKELMVESVEQFTEFWKVLPEKERQEWLAEYNI